MKRAGCWCALAVIAAASVAAHPVRLTFVVEPAQALPGIPVTFRVTAVNTGAGPASIPSHVRLELIGGDEMAIAYPNVRGENDPVAFPTFGGVQSIQLEPGEERKLDYLAGPGSPPWFCDERLKQPGMYRLRIRADLEFTNGSWGAMPDPVISNEAVLTIVTPSGVDAAAWALIGGEPVCLGWDSHAAALWSQHPDSIYTSMTVRPSPRRDRVAELASLEATLAKNPPAGFADALKLSIANRHLMFMQRSLIDGDVQSAFEHAEAARLLLEELVTEEAEAELKAAAQQSLRTEVMSLPELQDYEARIRRVAPPRLRCETAQVAVVRAEIAQVVASPATTSKSRTKLEAVLKHLDRYVAEAAKTPSGMSGALHELRSAVTEIDNASRSLIDGEAATRWMRGLANAAAISAKKAVDVAAGDSAARANMLAQAQQNLAEAGSAAEQSDFKTALRLYKAALDKAESASRTRGAFC